MHITASDFELTAKLDVQISYDEYDVLKTWLSS